MPRGCRRPSSILTLLIAAASLKAAAAFHLFHPLLSVKPSPAAAVGPARRGSLGECPFRTQDPAGIENVVLEAMKTSSAELPHSAAAVAHQPYFKVVTAVVLEPGTGRILSLKRSNDVRSYKGHWHFVSGGMEREDEGDVVHRAHRELEEEVKLLANEHLELVCQGRPLLVTDSRRPLLVHPVLFRLKEPYPGPVLDSRVLNWENTDIQWATLEQLRGMETVPRLLETAERLLRVERRGPWPAEVEQAIRRITEDRTHGAMELAQWAVDALALWADTTVAKGGAVEGVEEDLRDLGYTLAMTRPAMAPVGNAVAAVVASAIRAAEGQPAAAVVDAVRRLARQFTDEAKQSNQQLIEAAAQDLRGRIEAALRAKKEEGHEEGGGQPQPRKRKFSIITISMSSTITGVLRRLAEDADVRDRVRVIVCESRPLLEGGRLAAVLAELGYEVTLITDAQMAVFAADSDLAILGADAVLPGGEDGEAEVVNKVGSLPLALCCQHHWVPVMAVTASIKIAYSPNRAKGEGGEEKGKDEVLSGELERLLGGAQVGVRNVYFEGVPLSLVGSVVTEDGVLDKEGVERRHAHRRAAFEAAFYV